MIECLCDQVSPTVSRELADLQTRAYASIGTRAWSPQEIVEMSASPHIHIVTARNRDGVLQGFLCMSLIEGEGDILSVAVDPNHRRRRVASRLINFPGTTNRITKPSRLVLEVAETNTNAISLYRMLGFRDIAVRNGYYLIDGNRVDALVMERCRSR